ncbi:hypothetical protein [Anaerobranca gottschalkii]|uniref:Uncharacterized protein n=1 Tax=Anaerobranca gottschalkii DSM 13577 TaxID=1120990 RepID=A0A1I0BDY2_9FIRM|nr:hypothetical protein [Anaerobranca gottschalkii]SET04736.1 hypothetical protein SAMN03080614_103712 [Anaerobranca gottschalkii DSM 13577]
MSNLDTGKLVEILIELNNIKAVEIKKIKGSVEVADDLSSFLSDCQKRILYLDRAIQYYQGFLESWKAFLKGEKYETDDPISRTAWVVHNDIITIAIKRPNSKYATTIRLSIELAKEIIDFTLNYIDKNGFVRRSDILNQFEEKIIETTSYNRTSVGQVIYAILLVLLKEGVIVSSENNKREYVRGIKASLDI